MRHYEGFSNKKIAEMEGLEPHAVGKYMKNCKSKGLVGLEIKHSTGAKIKLNKKQEAKIVEVITNKTPDEAGFEYGKN